MKILIICSGNSKDGEFVFEINQAFIYEQVEEVKKLGIQFDIFLIEGKGVGGYLKNYFKLIKKILSSKYNLLHSHFALSGLLGTLVLFKKNIITFHGSDININRLNYISSVVSLLSSWRIFVNKELYKKIKLPPKKKYDIIPCGVNLELFTPKDMLWARSKLGLSEEKKYILFTSSFNNPVKNSPLAIESCTLVANAELLELKKRTREEVSLLLNACDMLLLTSFSEGSPQIIKEAMACNCPIVSTDVGDIKELIGNTEGCYLCSYAPYDVAEKINQALRFNKRTKGREKVQHLDNKIIAKIIFDIYEKAAV